MGTSASAFLLPEDAFLVSSVFIEAIMEAFHLGSFHAAKEVRMDSEQNGAKGKPGMNVMNASMAERIQRALKEKKSWWVNSLPRLSFAVARVTRIPVAVERMRAGIWETRPSPMDNKV